MEQKIDFVVEHVMLNKVKFVEFFVLINLYYQIEPEIDVLVTSNNDHDEMINKHNNLVYIINIIFIYFKIKLLTILWQVNNQHYRSFSAKIERHTWSV